MNSNDLLLKRGIYFSIIVFSICFMIMLTVLPYTMFGNIENEFLLLFVGSSILLGICSILLFVMAIVMIIKICSDNTISTTDKVIWSIITYMFNTFTLPFAYEKFIAKSNDYKSATKLVVFHGISIVLSSLVYVMYFIKLVKDLDL